MSAVIGVFSFTVAVLVFAVAALASRNPSAPAWLTNPPVADIVAIGIVSPGVIGIGFLIQSVASFGTQPPSFLQVTLIVTNLAIFVLIWKQLKVRNTLAKYAQQTAEMKTSAANTTSADSAPVAAREIKLVTIGTVTTVPKNPNSPFTPRTPGRPKKAA